MAEAPVCSSGIFWVTLCRLDIDFQITMHRPESDT
jgi:hypothetical protein